MLNYVVHNECIKMDRAFLSYFSIWSKISSTFQFLFNFSNVASQSLNKGALCITEVWHKSLYDLLKTNRVWSNKNQEKNPNVNVHILCTPYMQNDIWDKSRIFGIFGSLCFVACGCNIPSNLRNMASRLCTIAFSSTDITKYLYEPLAEAKRKSTFNRASKYVFDRIIHRSLLCVTQVLISLSSVLIAPSLCCSGSVAKRNLFWPVLRNSLQKRSQWL